MVRSFPCVSINALGNSANLVSSAVGRRDFASLKMASTAGDDAVVKDQLYYIFASDSLVYHEMG